MMRSRAAQYLRVSTGRQGCSLERQMETIAAFAEKNEIEIVKTFSDGARSGLTLKGRPAMKSLLSEIHSLDPGFSKILVYDVSRWGRFQDVDEGAFYEQLCKRAGIPVFYIADLNINTGTPIAQIVKTIKRIVAAEFSRDLSEKVFRAHIKLAKMGYLQGGVPSYGLRRAILDLRSGRVSVLEAGQRKSVGSNRIILVLGPHEEVETIRRIFGLYVNSGFGVTDICQVLNNDNSTGPTGRPWTVDAVRAVLRNERYAGVITYARTDRKMCGPRKINPAPARIRVEGGLEAIVSPELFSKAMARRRQRRNFDGISDEEFLRPLEEILKREGRLDWALIRSEEGLPSWGCYWRRFGGMDRILRRLGHAASVETG